MTISTRRGAGSRYEDFRGALQDTVVSTSGVSGNPLTDDELRASPVEVSVSGSSPFLVTSSSSQVKLSRNYVFDASSQSLTINDGDYYKTLSVINLTDGIVIYNPSSPGLGGTSVEKSLNFDYDTTSMDDGDDLMVLYEYTDVDTKENLLEEILIELKKQTKFLEKICK